MKGSPSLKEILGALRQRGHRITPARQRVVELLFESDVPLSAAELLDCLRKSRSRINKTTIYRELEFLHHQKIIRQIDLLEGKKRYELVQTESHHHHAVCTNCQSIQCIEMGGDLRELEKRLLTRHRFQVTSHSLEFFGLCAKCSAALKSPHK